jgi:hypothetical protein
MVKKALLTGFQGGNGISGQLAERHHNRLIRRVERCPDHPLPDPSQYLGDALTDRIKHASGGGKFILQFEGASYSRITVTPYLLGLA